MKKIFVILGMHRSGTSLTSAGLHYAGLEFGNELMGANAGNPKGHWEDNDVVALNNRILSQLGLAWDYAGKIERDKLELAELDPLRKEACALIKSKLDKFDNYAFKDPRTVRLLPFWINIFDRLQENIEVNYIFVCRNPIDVCYSLAKRDNKSIAHSQLLWLHHNLDNLDLLLGKKTFCVDFYQFCKTPKASLKAVSNQLNFDSQDSEIELFAAEFLDLKLLTSNLDSFVTSQQKKLLSVCFDAYRLFKLLHLKRLESAEAEQLARIRKHWLIMAEPLAEQLNIINDEIILLSKQVGDRALGEIKHQRQLLERLLKKSAQ